MTLRRSYRSVLFVPADRTDRVLSAPSRGADAIVADLEDAVAPDRKAGARASLAELLVAGRVEGRVMVRVNAAGTPYIADDVAALAPALGSLDALVLPMSSPDGVAELHRLLAEHGAPEELAIVALAETAAGILDARETAAASPRVTQMLFGPADLSAELGVTVTAEGTELAHARAHLVLASAAAGLLPPIDGPYLNVDDAAGLVRSVRAARTLGFGGKAAIHPAQLAAVHAGFAPDAATLDWAREVVAAAESATADGSGVARLADGTFVDEPIARRARALLAQAGAGAGA
ncbi:HpcH/HpaI aldolase/citrate lyase family protein [Pseudonocardia sp.]|uniref:HpcH/HpaI aldolase/citrate lyase family protein n=1 Tax=Pseudonocardia sp. TaxID=60912 RepID=UPI003D0ADC01